MIPKEIEITTVDGEYYSQVVDSYNAAMNIVKAIKRNDTYEFTDEDGDVHIIFKDKIIDICITDGSYKSSSSLSGGEIIGIITISFLALFVLAFFIYYEFL